MEFWIEREEGRRDNLGAYWYRIYQGKRLVARYGHDFRGDEHFIEFVGGPHESWPVGRVTDFLNGGGPQPLRLSEDAVKYLERNISRSDNLPGDGLNGPAADRARSVAEILWRENPLRLVRYPDDIGFADYARHVSHIALMIENGCRASEIADYLEKITWQRGQPLAREMALGLAARLVKSTSPPDNSPDRTCEK